MEYRKLGQSDLESSVISMGCWGIAGGQMWGKQDEKDAIKAIRTAHDLGINLFDTAEAYGDGYSEKVLGEALADRRNEVLIASKVKDSNLDHDSLKDACEGSLKRLDTDYIDLYYIHWPNHDIPIQETARALEELKKEGKIRHYATSNFGVRDLDEILEHTNIDVNQLPYSLLWRSIEFGIQSSCIENDVSMACYSPLVHGLLTGKFENPEDVPDGRARTRHFSSERPHTRHGEEGVEEKTFRTIDAINDICREAGIKMVHASIAWVLSRKGVGTVITGARNPNQVKSNVRAAEIDISEEVLNELTDVTEDLKSQLGDNPDMWEGSGDSRYR